jgi:hypothetical protein
MAGTQTRARTKSRIETPYFFIDSGLLGRFVIGYPGETADSQPFMALDLSDPYDGSKRTRQPLGPEIYEMPDGWDLNILVTTPN